MFVLSCVSSGRWALARKAIGIVNERDRASAILRRDRRRPASVQAGKALDQHAAIATDMAFTKRDDFVAIGTKQVNSIGRIAQDRLRARDLALAVRQVPGPGRH